MQAAAVRAVIHAVHCNLRQYRARVRVRVSSAASSYSRRSPLPVSVHRDREGTQVSRVNKTGAGLQQGTHVRAACMQRVGE